MRPLLTNSDEFIQNEFRTVEFGDKRLNKRTLQVATTINASPGISLPAMTESYRKQLKGIYRFFQNDKVCEDKILQAHYANTVERMGEYKGRILLLNDSTFISPAKSMNGLMNRGKGKENCVRVHFTLAISEDGNQIFGILGFNCLSKIVKDNSLELQDESHIWIKTTEESIQAIEMFSSKGKQLLPRCIFVADREADEFELMRFLIKSNLGFIIRSQYNRIIKDGKLFDKFPNSKKHGARYFVKTKKNNSIKENQVERSVLRNISILPPVKHRKDYTPIDLNMVLVQEVNEEEKPLSWKIWTTEEITDTESSERIVNYYAHRWKIEEVNKAAKTGVRVEDRQFTSLSHFIPFLAMAFVVAWRILALRTVKEVNGNTCIKKAFTEDEVQYLKAHAETLKIKMKNVEDATLLIAQIGGFTKKDKKPGWQVLWPDWMRFYDRVLGFQLARKFFKK